MLTEEQRRDMADGKRYYMTGCMQKFDTPNGNGRVYKKKILQREVENYWKLVKERRALGELDHPEDSVINLKNASHLVTVEDDFQLICFDFVSEQSTPGAFMMKESKNPNIFTKADKINRIMNDILRDK